MPVERPKGLTDEEKAAWLEGPEGRKLIDEAELRPVRFTPVTMRFPESLRGRIRDIATRRGMGYQTLARQWLLERCDEEEAKEAPKELQGFISGLDPVDRRIVLLSVRGWTVKMIAEDLAPPLPATEVAERLEALADRCEEDLESESERNRSVLKLLREAS